MIAELEIQSNEHISINTKDAAIKALDIHARVLKSYRGNPNESIIIRVELKKASTEESQF